MPGGKKVIAGGKIGGKAVGSELLSESDDRHAIIAGANAADRSYSLGLWSWSSVNRGIPFLATGANEAA